MAKPLLEIDAFSLAVAKPRLGLVDRVCLSLGRGEILGIIGESGCGKSMLALSVMRLHDPHAFKAEGNIFFNGKNLLACSPQEMISMRGNDISMIFQEPMTSLNPVLSIGNQISEIIRLHRKVGKKQAWLLAQKTLEQMAIPAPGVMMDRFPHELSGGMRQRVMIAMAMANSPQVLIADEPTTALDVTIQAQILELFLELRDQTETGIIFITHDLGVVAEICDRAAVMYAGRIVEEAPVGRLFASPKHWYTVGLMESLPSLNTNGSHLRVIPGSVPPPQCYEGDACRFHARCPNAQKVCRSKRPEPQVFPGGHTVHCHFPVQEAISCHCSQ